MPDKNQLCLAKPFLEPSGNRASFTLFLRLQWLENVNYVNREEEDMAKWKNIKAFPELSVGTYYRMRENHCTHLHTFLGHLFLPFDRHIGTGIRATLPFFHLGSLPTSIGILRGVHYHIHSYSLRGPIGDPNLTTRSIQPSTKPFSGW
jgi:hypothetical protein